jgi:hypothetical protein
MILFCLKKKTSVSASIFKTGQKIMINRVLRRIFVNQNSVCRKALNSNLSVFQY